MYLSRVLPTEITERLQNTLTKMFCTRRHHSKYKFFYDKHFHHFQEEKSQQAEKKEFLSQSTIEIIFI